MKANRIWLGLFALSVPALFAGCDSQTYTAIAAGDGGVIIVNRYTGSVQKVQGNSIIELRTPTGADQPPTVSLSHGYVAKQPLSVSAVAKYHDGTMLFRLLVEPNAAPKTEQDWEAWRSHLTQLRNGSAALRLVFVDKDQFSMADRTIELSELTGRVAANGDLHGYSGQFEVPMTRETFRGISSWVVGWSGSWVPYEGQTASEPAKETGR